MKSFFAALSRNVGTLLLSLAIVAGLSYYLLGYVPQQTASLNARYFRVLSRIGYNVREEIKAQHLNDEGDARSVAHLMSYELNDFWKNLHSGSPKPLGYGPSEFVEEANQLLADRPGPDKYRIEYARDTGAYKYSMRLQDQQFRFGYLVPPAPAAGARRWGRYARQAPTAAKASAKTTATHARAKPVVLARADTADTYELIHTVPVDSLVRALRRPDVFDYFFVLELPSHRLLYSSDRNDFYLFEPDDDKASKRRLPRWLADSTLAHTGQTGAFPFGGQAYQLFAQPVRLGPRLSCLLVGGVNSQRFGAERRALPAGGPEALVSALLLGVLALPFLKLRLMSPREQIHRRDVLLSAASLVLGLGVLLLTLQAFAAKCESDCLIKNHLAKLAKDVAKDLHAELAQLNNVVRQTDQSLRSKPQLLVGGAIKTLPEEQAAPSAAYASRQETNPLSDDYLTWMTLDGQAQYGLNPAGPDQAAHEAAPDALAKTMRLSYCLPALGGRRYLRKIKTEDYQLVSSDACRSLNGMGTFIKDTCYFDMLRTVRNASQLRVPSPAYEQDVPHLKAVLARPSKWNPTLLCVLETRLLCFDDGIIPPGYGFCLIEPNGEVMAHSDSNLNLSENLLQDCEPSNELEAVLYAQQQQPGKAIEVTYQGKPTLLYVYPLPGMKRYLITFFDRSYAKAQQSQTSLLAFTLLGGFWLLVAAVALLNWLVLRAVRQRLGRDRFQSLWPRPACAARYWQVVAGQALGLGALAWVAMRVGPFSQLCLLAVVPLLLFVLTYHHTRLRATYRRSIMLWVLGLAGALLLGLLGLHWYLVGGRETARLADLALGLGTLVGGLLLPSGRASRLAQPCGQPTYRAAYTSMLVGWIVLLAIVPALSCYRVAQVVENVQHLRAGQMQLLKDYEKGEARAVANQANAQYAKTRSSFYYYTKFFFSSQFNMIWERDNTHQVDSADLATLRLFTALRQPMTRPGEEAAKALFVDTTANAPWHPWLVTSLAGDTLTLDTRDNANSTQVVSHLAGLQLGWPHAWPTRWAAAGWWLLGGLRWALVLGGLWALISYLLRRLFGLSAEAVASPRLPVGPVLPATTERRFWLLPAGSTWADVPAWARPGLGPPDRVQVLDCRQYGPLPDSEWPTVLTGLPRPTEAEAGVAGAACLVLASFDCRLTDTGFTKRKIELLSELQQCGWPLVVLSASHPEAFGDCGHPLEKPCPEDGHRAIREVGERLLDALAEFRMEYFTLQGSEPAPLPGEPAARRAAEDQLFKNNRVLRRFFERECQAFAFLASLRPVLLAKLWQQHQVGQPLTHAAIEMVVQRLAQFHFRRLWLALAPQEKFLLFDLAQDGLVNTDNARALGILLQKGFLRRANNGRLALRSASFRGFILTAQRKQEAMQYVAASERGTWAATQTPLLLLLAAGALFMFITQPTTFTQTQTFLLSLTGLLPTLAGLVNFLLKPKISPSVTAE